MHDIGSAEQKGFGLVAQLLIWGGVLLLLAGGLLVHPYVSSRLATFSSTPAPTPSLLHPAALLPTVISAASTNTPTPPFPPPHRGGKGGVPTRILIPAIGVDAPVVPVSWYTVEAGDQMQAAWEVPEMYAAGWHETSAPLGMAGNTVLNGHNTTHGEVFRDLYTLEIGDTIIVYADDTSYTYAVTEVLILPEAGQPLEVRRENARYVMPADDERLTLVTCHPYGSLRYRLVVIAHPRAMNNETMNNDQ